MKSEPPLKRRRKICRSIRLAWSSLETHLEHAIKAPKDPKLREIAGDEKFNTKSILEYAEMIMTLANELDHLAPIRKSKPQPSSSTPVASAVLEPRPPLSHQEPQTPRKDAESQPDTNHLSS